MTRDLFCRVGGALYGPRWQSELARDLGVSDRTVRRWAAGEQPIPDTAADLCATAVLARMLQLNALARELTAGSASAAA